MSYLIFRDQQSFMRYFGQAPSPETMRLYMKLINEESRELLEAWHAVNDADSKIEHVAEMANEAIDLIYVTVGLIHAMGLDPQPLWDEIQKANLAKITHRCPLCAEGEESEAEFCAKCHGSGVVYEARLRDDGKVLKPEGWQKADLLPIVRMMLEARGMA